MSVIREYGDVIFECDTCGNTIVTETSDFYAAWQKANSEGWVATRSGKDWIHRCRECEEEQS